MAMLGVVLGEYAALLGPETGGFGLCDERCQQALADALASTVHVHVDAVLCDAGIAGAGGDGGERGPGDNFIVDPAHQTTFRAMVEVECFPIGRFGLKHSVAGGYAVGVDAPNGRPVRGQHWRYRYANLRCHKCAK